jgi:prepilin-type N-terminal cleavage/methylation domain-containing protein
MRNARRGFTLAETLIAMVLVAFSMTALVASFTASSRLGTLTRRQANAVAIGKKWVAALSTAPWADARLVNNNTGNDANYMDPQSLFARDELPIGSDAPDWLAAGTTQLETDSSGE